MTSKRTWGIVPAVLCTIVSTAVADSSRPNILFAFADDWGRYASAYSVIEQGGLNDLINTPNFDRIAKEGVLFTNAFVNAPSCTPCRSSLLSGQYFWRTGRGRCELRRRYQETGQSSWWYCWENWLALRLVTWRRAGRGTRRRARW